MLLVDSSKDVVSTDGTGEVLWIEYMAMTASLVASGFLDRLIRLACADGIAAGKKFAKEERKNDK